MRRIDISGLRFGRLVAREAEQQLSSSGRKKIYWLCQCDCGATAIVASSALRSGATMSCGCLNLETQEIRTAKRVHTTKAYRTWRNMRERCAPDGHQSYGKRGIRVCDMWANSFAAFLADVGEPPSDRHSIDRIDPNGDYCPGNVRWATSKEQASNRRDTRFVTIDGERIPLAVASARFGVSHDKIRHRLDYGWTDEEAVSLSKRKRPAQRRASTPLPEHKQLPPRRIG